jgi:hypothetical protein
MGEYFVTGSKGMNGYASEEATDAELAAYAAENMDDFMEFVKDNAALAVDKGNVRLETGRPAGEMLRRFANGDTFLRLAGLCAGGRRQAGAYRTVYDACKTALELPPVLRRDVLDGRTRHSMLSVGGWYKKGKERARNGGMAAGMEKDSFIVHLENEEDVAALTDEEAGQLFKAVFCYAREGEPPEMDKVVAQTFRPIRRRMDYDHAQYMKIKEKRSAAGKSGAEKRWRGTTGDGRAMAKENGGMAKRRGGKAKMALYWILIMIMLLKMLL